MTAKVSSFIHNHEWKLPDNIMQRDAALAARILQVTILKLPLKDNSDFMTVFASFNPNWSMFFTQVANAAVLHLVQTIWMARNGVRFNNASISVYAAITKILTLLSWSHLLISGDANTVEHAALQLLHLEPRTAQPVTVQLVLWQTPTVVWLKANTDSSVTHGSAACGGLFRDYLARFWGGYAQRVDGTVLHAELMAMILATELAHGKGWYHLWIESDSKAALQAFEDHNIVPLELRNRWSNCFS
ncbi:RNA-directed DNA polymerase (Reverse transcriptase) [Trifolium medium]|uniref:RNA-directed DNA polymerase (Reverse transcriptase) n=1 Tax=Trifolium medium TaxID=97028 RepID=A0A392LX58_9FABA|nr:RNA-directed DNA polymerase (Reverse transcriptase) [Trifolium medium]